MKIINTVSFDITYKCNYRCKHCYNSSGCHDDSLELSDSQALSIIEDVAAMFPDSICICGGEPLLKKELIYLIGNKLADLSPNTSISMVTNGYYLTYDVAKKFKKCGIKKIQISLDGAEATTHEWLRGKGTFNSAIKALEILKNVGIDSAVAFSPTKDSIGELPLVIELAKEKGCKEFRMQPLMLMGRALEHKESFDLSYTDYMYAKKIIDEKNMKYIEDEFECIWGDPLSHLKAARKNVFYHVIISATGQILVSPYLPITFGDLSKSKLIDYVDSGLLEVMKNNELVRYLIDQIDSVETMNLQAVGFSGENSKPLIELDMLADDYLEKTSFYLAKIKEYMKEKENK